jgi:hypothetical protein
VRDRHGRSIWSILILLAVVFFGAAPAWAANLREVAPPAVISQLAPAASATPQIYIVSPRSDEVLPSGTVNINLQVTGISVFKNAALGLGPHLHLLLDGSPHQSIYDLSQPISLPDLPPGTHTLQLLATKPWNETWKTPGALAQVTFHVLAKSIDSPNPNAPRLIYSPPNRIGAEPFLLDFQLTNPPSHSDPQHPQRVINDWRVRATINNQSFEVDRWQPYYLQGLNPGANLIKLEYLDKTGQVLDSSIRIVSYQPNGQDGSSRLLRNEVPLESAIALFDPNSRAIAKIPAQAPVATAPSILPTTTPVATMPPVAAAPVVPPAPAAPALPIRTPEPLQSNTPVPSASGETAVSAPANAVPTLLPSPPASPQLMPASPVPQPVIPAPVPIGAVPSALPVPSPTPPANFNTASPIVSSPMPLPVPSPAAPVPFPQPATPQEIIPPPVARSTGAAPHSTLISPQPTNPPLAAVPMPVAITPQTGEEVVEIKVILRELFRTLGVRIKQATNQIPPLVAQWSKNFGRWVTERMQAMRAPQASPDAVGKGYSSS